MVGVLLTAHGALAPAYLQSARMIAGEDLPHCAALELTPGEDLELYKARFLQAVRSLDGGEGVLVLADLFAGTPANVALQNLPQERYGLVTGANLGMVIEALSCREGAALSELKERALLAARTSIVDMNEKFGIKEGKQ